MGIAVDSSGNLYVADFGNNRVEKFTSDGNYITQWGFYGSGNGQFNGPWSVAVDFSGGVYVADFGTNRIQKFDYSGGYLAQWGSSGSGDGQFNEPYGLAVDSSGNLYVADSGNSRVEKFTSNGNYITQFAKGQLSYPLGVAVDSSGNVYVADTGNNCIRKFSSDGKYLTQWGQRFFSGTNREEQNITNILKEEGMWNSHANYELFVSVNVDRLPKPNGFWAYKSVNVTYEFVTDPFANYTELRLEKTENPKEVFLVMTNNMTVPARGNRGNPYWTWLGFERFSIESPSYHIRYHLYLYLVT
jgi:hypothetical protein